MPAQSEFLTFDGNQVFFKISPPEGALTHRVLLLCSPFMTAFNWRKLMPELNQLGCMCVLIDLPGFGKCTPFAGSLSRVSGMVWGVLDYVDEHYGIRPEAWHIISHGAAAPVALEMGANQPDSLASQVLITPLLPEKFRRDYPNRKSFERFYANNIIDDMGFDTFADKMFARHMDDYVLSVMRRYITRQGVSSAIYTLMTSPRTPDAMGGFCPMMALFGGRDIIVDVKAFQEFRAFMPRAERHVIRAAGHFPMETHTPELLDFLRGWLKFVG